MRWAAQPCNANAKQTEFCTYLSGILLAGLLLNALFGFWWADPVAGLIMVPIIAKEGIEELQGKACDDTVGANTVAKERSADSFTSSPRNNQT